MLGVFAVVVFALSGAWWLSGHRGGSTDEPGPLGMTLFLTAIAAGLMYGLGWLPC